MEQVYFDFPDSVLPTRTEKRHFLRDVDSVRAQTTWEVVLHRGKPEDSPWCSLLQVEPRVSMKILLGGGEGGLTPEPGSSLGGMHSATELCPSTHGEF